MVFDDLLPNVQLTLKCLITFFFECLITSFSYKSPIIVNVYCIPTMCANCFKTTKLYIRKCVIDEETAAKRYPAIFLISRNTTQIQVILSTGHMLIILCYADSDTI